jgi:hypothetical protein
MVDDASSFRQQLSKAVEEQCRKFGLKSTCPFWAADSSGVGLDFAAHLPQFGSEKGLLIDPYFKGVIAKDRWKLAEDLGFSVSFININSFVADPKQFIECLVDWGFHGLFEDFDEKFQRVFQEVAAEVKDQNAPSK